MGPTDNRVDDMATGLSNGDGDDGAAANGSGTDLPEFVSLYLREYLATADRKAALIIGASTALIAFLEERQRVLEFVRRPPSSWGAEHILGLLAALSLIAAATFGFLVIVPRGGSRVRNGLIYWRSIRERESAALYANEVLAASAIKLRREIAEQNYVLARIVHRKYDFVYWAVLAMAAGIFFTVAFLGFSKR